jgi:subtilisin family serine protease
MPTWTGGIAFLPNGDAIRPGNLLVHPDDADDAETVLGPQGWQKDPEDEADGPNRLKRLIADPVEDVVAAMAVLHQAGIPSQPNHVLFTPCASSLLDAAPVHASAAGVYLSPVHASSVIGMAGCHCCAPHPAGTDPAAWAIDSKVVASPVHASPVHASTYTMTGERASTVLPAPQPLEWLFARGGSDVVVAIIDTGSPVDALRPAALANDVHQDGRDVPDKDVPADAILDPVAGHGAFIAGVITQLAPNAMLRHIGLVGPCGDLDEHHLADRIRQLLDEDLMPAVLNLSLAGYASAGMADLAMAVREVQRRGTIVVAAAGNDATCRPTYPAVLPGVVGVGAVDAAERAAPFTNYGPWVRSCSFGVDVVSYFFREWQGDWRPPQEPLPADVENVRTGWAKWSGTSFAAPHVAGRIAEYLINNVGGIAPDVATVVTAVDEVLNTTGRSVPGLGRLVT